MQAYEVKIPDLGASVHVAEILVSEGDRVTKDQAIAVLESDKSSLDLMVPEDGCIEQINIKQGVACQPDDVFCVLSLKGQLAKALEEPPEPQVQTFNLPDMGSVSSQVAEIHKAVGDQVEKDDVLLSLESDKAMMDIPAPCSGTIEAFLVTVGDKVETDQVWLRMNVNAGNVSVTEEILPQQQSIESEDEDEPMYTYAAAAGPMVRKLAREWGVDLTQVRGSGYRGRISENDLKMFVQTRLAGSHSAVDSRPLQEHDFSSFGEVEREPLSRINMISAKHLQKCWQIPQVTQFFEVDFTLLEKTRQSVKAPLATEGVRMTPMVFMMKALSQAMRTFPKFNASLSVKEDAVLLKKYCHMGFAVDTENGLVVAVLRDVDLKGYKDLAIEIVDLSQQAREGILKPQQMQGGCITISSLGGIGGQGFTPIVNAPEVAILGVGKAQIKPVYVDGSFEPRYCIPMALSYDHRVIDGADAARFVVELTRNLEHMGASLTREDILGDRNE